MSLYLLYNHFFGKKCVANESEDKRNGKTRSRKREFNVDAFEEEFAALYAESLKDEDFLEFLKQAQDAGLLDLFAEGSL